MTRAAGQLAEPVLRESRARAHSSSACAGMPKPDGRDDAGDEDEDGRDQRGEHAAGAEQRPEDRFVGSFHVTATARMT